MKPPSRFESMIMYWETSILTTRIIGKTFLKCKCTVFTNIKQTLHYSNKVNTQVVLHRFFSFVEQKKWSLVMLDRWLSYTVMIVWELAWVDSALVVLDEWSSYWSGRISRFDCIALCDSEVSSWKQHIFSIKKPQVITSWFTENGQLFIFHTVSF